MSDSSAEAEDEPGIIAAIKAGQREHYEKLVERYKDRVFAMVMRQIGERGQAEDITQEVFVKAYLNLSRFDGRSRFSTWLIRIAINHSNSYLTSRTHRMKQRTESITAISETRQSAIAASHDAAHGDAKIELQRFRGALSALNEKLRVVLILCGLEGRSYQDAATTLAIPVGTVRSRLNKARLSMRQLLNEDN